jgi:hypothetical protein
MVLGFRAEGALECGSLLPPLGGAKLPGFEVNPQSGSKLPHSKGFAADKNHAVSVTLCCVLLPHSIVN